MLDIGALRMRITTDTEQAEKELKSFNDNVKEVGDKIGGVGKALTIGFTAPVVALGTVAVNTASDIEEGMNKLSAVYGDNTNDVTKWADASAKAYGMSKKTFIDSISTYGALSQDLLGMNEKQSAEFSKDLIGRASDISSYYNLSMEQSQSLIQQLFSGETEGWKQLGITINDTTMQEYALAQGITKSISEMSLQEKTMLRVEMAMSKTDRASGDFKNTSDGLANSTRIMQAQLSDLSAEIGAKLIPIVTDIVSKLNDWITKILEFSAEHPNLMTLIIALIGVLAVIPPLLILISTGITVITALSTALNIAMLPLTATIGVVIAVITGLIAIGVLLYKNWDVVKAKCIELATSIKGKFTEIGAKIKEVYTESIKPYIDLIVNGFNWCKEQVQNVIDGMISNFTNVVNKITGVIDKLKDLFFWQNKTSSSGGSSGGAKSSNYGGLDYVPYDNYLANLHKGERVLTATENAQYNQGINGGGAINVTQYINAPMPTPSEVARQTKNELKALRVALG